MGASNPTYAELDCRQRTPKLELFIYTSFRTFPTKLPHVQQAPEFFKIKPPSFPLLVRGPARIPARYY